jgi:hypothetical protein
VIYVFAGTPELAMGADQASGSLIVHVDVDVDVVGKAMPPALTLSSHPEQNDTSSTSAELAWLSGELRIRVEQAAAHAGLSIKKACEQWLRQGLEQAEQQRTIADTPERCSLRTGICSSGTVPLPVQQ